MRIRIDLVCFGVFRREGIVVWIKVLDLGSRLLGRLRLGFGNSNILRLGDDGLVRLFVGRRDCTLRRGVARWGRSAGHGWWSLLVCYASEVVRQSRRVTSLTVCASVAT